MLRRLRRNKKMNFLSMPHGLAPRYFITGGFQMRKKYDQKTDKKIVAYPNGVVVIQSMVDGEE